MRLVIPSPFCKRGVKMRRSGRREAREGVAQRPGHPEMFWRGLARRRPLPFRFAEEAALLDLAPADLGVLERYREFDVVAVRVIDVDRHAAEAVGREARLHFM